MAGKYPLGLHKVDKGNNIDKKKEIMDAAKRLIVQETKLMQNEEESSEDDSQNPSLYSKKILKKKKAMKKKQLAWQVSKVHENFEGVTEKKPEANTSWEVREASDDNKLNVPSTKKRKQNKELKSDKSTSNNEAKKSKMSEFSVSESKENSFSFPVSSTPINLNCKHVLTKSTSNIQNIQNGSAKRSKKQRKSLRNNTNKGNTSVSPDFNKEKEMEKATSTPVRTKNIHKKRKATAIEKTPELVLNTSTNTKNNGWGGEWDEPLQEGEYEIFIPNKNYVTKRKSLGLPYPVSSFVQKSAEKATPLKKLKVSTQWFYLHTFL